MNGLRSAIGFLTILPIAPSSDAGMASARAWFPLVGLMLGCALAALDLLMLFLVEAPMPWQGLSSSSEYIPLPALPLLRNALLVLALVLATRALHLDGFMDACDSLFGGFSRERRLAILRDPNVGAFAVVGVVSLLLLKFAALVELPALVRLPVLILFPCLSRWGMLLAMDLFPYARRDGLGTAFMMGKGGWQLALGFVVALLACFLTLGALGVVFLALAGASAWAVGAWASRLLDGLTGDIYGGINEITEVLVLLLAVVLASKASSVIALNSPLMRLFAG